MAISVQSGAASQNGNETRPRRSREERKKRAANRRPKGAINSLVFNPFFILLFGLLVVSCLISFFLVFSHPEGAWGASVDNNANAGRIPPKPKEDNNPDARHRLNDAEQMDAMQHGYAAAMRHRLAKEAAAKAAEEEADDGNGGDDGDDGDDGNDGKEDSGGEKTQAERFSGFDPELNDIYQNIKPFDKTIEAPHLYPKTPQLPIFAEIENGDQLIDDLLHNNKPTIAGIVAFFNKYLQALHVQNKALSAKEARDKTGENIDEMGMVKAYYELTAKIVDPLEDAYRGRTIFPVREDESVFVSLAAFREHLLGKSMMSAFDNAKDPSKLFIGAIVQNCFGLDGTVCKTGIQVVGTRPDGRPKTSVSPAPPDANGIEEFCTHEKYKHFCDNGQVRVIYLHDTDALGPQTARFYASKLWGGETYFMQMDSHLEFAPEWDQYYIDEVRASKNYPKSILSAYPPGFKEYDGGYKGGTRGERLCGAHFSTSGVEYHILRIEQLGLTPRNAKYPTQIPYIAAGFFFAHSSFLKDVPFDPYAPWCFMGEEIALSIRAWTNGWNIYAPRKNVIAHQYRPGRLGLPKFWESVGRDTDRGSLNTRLQRHVIRRVKHMLSYPTETRELITKEGDGISLYNYNHYTLGHERKLEDYLQLTKINPTKLETGKLEWCLKSELP